tara:strand:+ start:4108 stop:4986 length:879 start_codon:yes stop_codon:yes gene_type:complete
MIKDIGAYSLKDMKLVSFGEILFDRICGKYYLGGAPLNFSWYASQMGANVSLVSSVGRDGNGDLALNKIFSSGIEPIVTRNSSPTGLVDVRSDGTFSVHKGSAWENIPPPVIPEINFQMLYFGTLSQMTSNNRSTLGKILAMNPKYVLTDINLRAPNYTPEIIEKCLSEAAVVKMNRSEWEVVSKVTGIQDPEILMSKKSLSALAVTNGSEGATLYSAAGGIEFKPERVEEVDPTGSGDAFTAVLAVGILTNAHPAQALAAACQAGATVASKKGALVDLPEDVRRAYDEQPL